MRTPSYAHSQWMWPLWVALPAASAAGVIALLADLGPDDARVAIVVAVAGLAVLLVLGKLTVEIDDALLQWRFGLLGWPRWRLPLADIAAVEKAGSTLAEGWGIRRTREGMLYNASGRLAVRLRLRDGRTIRLGSDEPERLAAFIAARLHA